jgi:hypothetical protein
MIRVGHSVVAECSPNRHLPVLPARWVAPHVLGQERDVFAGSLLQLEVLKDHVESRAERFVEGQRFRKVRARGISHRNRLPDLRSPLAKMPPNEEPSGNDGYLTSLG